MNADYILLHTSKIYLSFRISIVRYLRKKKISSICLRTSGMSVNFFNAIFCWATKVIEISFRLWFDLNRLCSSKRKFATLYSMSIIQIFSIEGQTKRKLPNIGSVVYWLVLMYFKTAILLYEIGMISKMESRYCKVAILFRIAKYCFKLEQFVRNNIYIDHCDRSFIWNMDEKKKFWKEKRISNKYISSLKQLINSLQS